jgi:aconitate hydratase
VFELTGIAGASGPAFTVHVNAKGSDGKTIAFDVLCRIDTPDELSYYKNGGILQYVLRSMRG